MQNKYTFRAILRRALVLAALLPLATTTLEAQTPAPKQDGPIALTGATIHTLTRGTIESGTIVFEDGVITEIGRNVQIPANAQQVDVRGRHIYPGLIDGNSSIGLTEIGGIGQSTDLSEHGNINPNVRAEVAFNAESRHIGLARSAGILVTLSSPSGGLISGLAAAMQLEGWTWEEMTLKSGTGLILSWPGAGNENQYARQIQQIREIFATAKAYRTARRAAEAGEAPPVEVDPRWEAMLPVLDGEIPVIVGANDLRQIQDAVTWAEEEDVRIIIRGGRDADYVADHLARKQIPVMLTSVLASPGRAWEPYDHAYALPARLYAAGVPFAIVAGSSAAYANRLPFEAGAAIAYGLPADEALKAVTLYPARFLGIDDRVGSLETGKDATFIITDGHPLEYATNIEQAYVQGRKADMMDAHRQFFEKYRERLRQGTARTPAGAGNR